MTPWPARRSAHQRLPSGVVKISDIRCRRRSIRTRPDPEPRPRRRARCRTSCRRCRSTSSSVPTGCAPSPASRSAAASSSVRSVDLDGDQLAGGGDVGGGRRAQQPAGVDDDDVVADPLELAEQVRGDQDRDAELGADPADQPEHVVAPGRVEAVRRLVEQHQLRVVDQRLRQLDPLLHAGRVAADRAVPLLVEPDVAQGVRRPLAGRRLAAARTSAPCARRTRSPTRPAAGSRARACSRPARGSPAPRWRRRGPRTVAEPEVGGQQAEHHLDQRRLARAVRPDQPDDAGLDVDGELGDGGDRCVPLGEVFGPDESHSE